MTLEKCGIVGPEANLFYDYLPFTYPLIGWLTSLLLLLLKCTEKKAIHKYHLLKSQSSSKLYVWRMETPLLLFWNTLRSFSISSSILRLSSSSLMIISTCPMLLWSLIFRYSSGLLSITKLFSIMFLKGLISFPRLSPKDFRDNIEKGAVI